MPAWLTDHDVVSGERELEPCLVRVKAVKREVLRAGRLQRLDAVLDFGVLTVGGLEGGDVRVLLVCDEALEAVAVRV